MLKTIYKFWKENLLAIIIIFFALSGFVAALTLSVEKLEILKNPDIKLPCSISSIFDCGVVMKSKYAEVYGIPWSFLGVAGYPAVMLLGLVIIERKKLSLWLSSIVSLGAFGAFALSTYFMYVSAYAIGVFCPWCILSAISSTAIFFTIIIYNLAENNYNLPEKQATFFAKKIKGGWALPIVVAWYIFMILLEYFPFWFYSR